MARCTAARLTRAAGLRGINRGKGSRTTVPGIVREDAAGHAEAASATAMSDGWVASGVTVMDM